MYEETKETNGAKIFEILHDSALEATISPLRNNAKKQENKGDKDDKSIKYMSSLKQVLKVFSTYTSFLQVLK